jgi:hypothetical protein
VPSSLTFNLYSGGRQRLGLEQTICLSKTVPSLTLTLSAGPAHSRCTPLLPLLNSSREKQTCPILSWEERHTIFTWSPRLERYHRQDLAPPLLLESGVALFLHSWSDMNSKRSAPPRGWSLASNPTSSLAGFGRSRDGVRKMISTQQHR